MSSQPTWGVVATVKAPDEDILNFAAWHLDQGAHRVVLYLDEDAPVARTALKAHPKCRVIVTDMAHWDRRRPEKGRPNKHQVRQSVNATHCYSKGPQVDWLLHCDVDEFLWCDTPIASQLSALPATTLSARVHPLEVLAPDPSDSLPPGIHWCKGCSSDQKLRKAQTKAIYPDYGAHLTGGFLSHVSGKIFVRTGQPNVTLRIHNAFHLQLMDNDAAPLTQSKLIHTHARSLDHWLARYRYRLAYGAYRSELRPAPSKDGSSLTLHALFQKLENEGGETALRDFYTSVCTATPDLRARLEVHGQLYQVTLDLDAVRHRHFPKITETS